MTNGGGRQPREGEAGGGSAAILRAIGSLLVALSGSDEHAQERAQRLATDIDHREPREGARGTEQEPGGERLGRGGSALGEADVNDPTGGLRPPGRDPGSDARSASFDQPPTSAIPPSTRGDEVEWLLADARARAQQILDESMAKAEELLAERPAGAGDRVLAEIRRAVADLVEGMTEVRQRLARIEALLEERETARPPSRAQPPAPAEERRASPMPSIPSRPERPPFSVVPPDAPPSATPPAQPPRPAGDEAAPAADLRAASQPGPRPEPRPAPEPPVSPPSDREPAGPPPPMPPPPPPATPPAPPVEDAFLPDRGAVLLRVSPVAGFQGLMRVQDALGRIDAVRQATVEAYAQGEARLRLELSAPIRPDEIARGLQRALEQRAEVRSSSIPERGVLIALG